MIERTLPIAGRRLVWCILWMLLSSFVSAQSPSAPLPANLTLADAMDLVLRQNPVLLREKQNLTIADSNLRQARLLRLIDSGA